MVAAPESPLLTPRQLEVLELMAKGLVNREIAEVLECAEGTVKVHLHKGRKRLADRLDVELGEAL